MRASLFLTVLLSVCITPITYGQCGQNYDREVRRIVKASEKLPHEKTRIVFAGSSTFRLWDNMAESFPEYEVVNAGIGGSCFDDLYRYKDATHFRHRTRISSLSMKGIMILCM